MSVQLPLLLLRMVAATASSQLKFRLRRIRTKFIFGSSLMDNEVSRVIFEDFLPRALKEGRYLAVPEPYVVGEGLKFIQSGFDVQKRGVSAKKVVVSL